MLIVTSCTIAMLSGFRLPHVRMPWTQPLILLSCARQGHVADRADFAFLTGHFAVHRAGPNGNEPVLFEISLANVALARFYGLHVAMHRTEPHFRFLKCEHQPKKEEHFGYSNGLLRSVRLTTAARLAVTRSRGAIMISWPHTPAPTPRVSSSMSEASTNERKPSGCQ